MDMIIKMNSRSNMERLVLLFVISLFCSCSVPEKGAHKSMTFDEEMALMADVFLKKAKSSFKGIRIQEIFYTDSIYSYEYVSGERIQKDVYTRLSNVVFFPVGGWNVYCEDQLPNSYMEKNGYLFLWDNPNENRHLPDRIIKYMKDASVVFDRYEFFMRMGTSDEPCFNIYYLKENPYRYKIRYEVFRPLKPPKL